MKKIYLSILLSSCLLAACGVKTTPESTTEEQTEIQDETQQQTLEATIDHPLFESPMSFTFSSGAGAWYAQIELEADGSFTGHYQDEDGGDSGEGYLATMYISEFSGIFDEIKKIDDDTYALTLTQIAYEHEVGKEWIENDYKYIASEAHGLADGIQFMLYSPNKLTADLDEDFLSWGRMMPNEDEQDEKLQRWALENVSEHYGFFHVYAVDESTQAEQPVSTEIATTFANMTFEQYDGPGAEFIGTWNEINPTTIGYAPNPWRIDYKDGLFYIEASLPGDPATLIMTAEYRDGALHSTNATQIEHLEYADASGQIQLPATVTAGTEVSTFFFEDNYLQWHSEFRGDMRENGITGYVKE